MSARVGEVRGEYHAEFALVRADEGSQRLALRLLEGEKEVLRRELPLDSAGCQDAAQTIALVLERYFDAIERPAPAPTAELETVAESAVRPATPPLQRDAAAASPAPARPRDFRLRAGFLYDHQLGAAAAVGGSVYPRALQLTSSLRLGFSLDLSAFFARQTETFREQRIEAFLLQGALSLPLTWSRSIWSASVGPWAQLRLQRAEGPTLERDQAAFRTLPGFGGFVQVGLELTPSWGLLAGVSAGPQLRSAASRYVLNGAAGQIAVLVPGAWFGQGQLTLELKF